MNALPTITALRARGKRSRVRLIELFEHRQKLNSFRKQMDIGISRICAEEEFAVVMARYMTKNGVRTLEDFLETQYLGEDSLQTLLWLRDPQSLSHGSTKRRHDTYLLALCNLEWNPRRNAYVIS